MNQQLPLPVWLWLEREWRPADLAKVGPKFHTFVLAFGRRKKVRNEEVSYHVRFPGGETGD